MRNNLYEERLKIIILFSLQKRRLPGDLMRIIKIENQVTAIRKNFSGYIENLSQENNGLQLRGNRFYADIGKYFYANRVIEHWTILPATVVNTKRAVSFNMGVDDVGKLSVSRQKQGKDLMFLQQVTSLQVSISFVT